MIRVALRGKSHGAVPVLGPVCLRVARGEVAAILGPSGIGKTTLLRVIAGLDTGYEGQVACPAGLAMVFQEPNLLPWRSALDNILLAHAGLGAAAARDMLGKVGLAGREARFPGQLSLGQQRRLALARAFAGEPQALILDEPFASLDPETAAGMVALTRRLIAEIRPATVLVTHARAEAEQLATRILRLDGSPAVLHEATA